MNSPITDYLKQNQLLRFLMLDDQQNHYNEIIQVLEKAGYQPQAKLIDDQNSFEKLINLSWDVVLYHNAYDISYKKTMNILKQKQKNIPLILLSEIDVRSEEALSIYQHGVFSILTAYQYDFIGLMLSRAATFSRNISQKEQLAEEIDQLLQHSENLVKSTDYPVAIFQEGIHVYVNEQYIAMFGQSTAEDFIGIPIMDIVNPEDSHSFKKAFKNFSKGEFSDSPLTVRTLNPLSLEQQLLIQFSATTFEHEPALQAVFIVDNLGQNHSAVPALHLDTIHQPELQIAQFVQQLNQALAYCSEIRLVFFVLTSLPDRLLHSEWDAPQLYFDLIQANLNQISPQAVQRLAKHLYVLPITDPHTVELSLDQLMQQLPSSILVKQQTYPVDIAVVQQRISSTVTSDELNQIINQAQQQVFKPAPAACESIVAVPSSELRQTEHVPEDSNALPSSLNSTGHSQTSVETHWSALAASLQQQLSSNRIQLHYQQFFDKEDINTQIYEISASFVHSAQQIGFDHCQELFSLYPELSIDAHRYVLVEASKQLHNYLRQHPKAKISVNLHPTCFADSELFTLFSQLLNLIDSKYKFPIQINILENDLRLDLEKSVAFCRTARELGIALLIHDFGQTATSHALLKKLDINWVKLSPSFSRLLRNDDGLVELQAQLDQLHQHCPDAVFMLCELNDMQMFANAWNVDVRYLQGDYYQAKQQEFVDSAS